MEKVKRTTSLKEFVDFAYSLKEMEEVKKGIFPVPKSITFALSKINHDILQKEILREKKMDPSTTELSEEFEVEIYGVTFIFVLK